MSILSPILYLDGCLFYINPVTTMAANLVALAQRGVNPASGGTFTPIKPRPFLDACMYQSCINLIYQGRFSMTCHGKNVLPYSYFSGTSSNVQCCIPVDVKNAKA
uniref:Uncharacterized protein n=1 Tax=Oryza meridionalis TaxID=40149 RepID=A0A0E0EVN5_9ORYZ